MSFTLWTMACGMIPWLNQALEAAETDQVWYPETSEESFIGQMRGKFFSADEPKARLCAGEHEKARLKRPTETGPDASCNPRTVWALGLHSCRALSSRPPKTFSIDQWQ
jgi:hypothetical protein